MTPRVLPLRMTETAFTSQLIDLFHQYKWRVVHVRPSQIREGRWVTHGAGDIAGWPDLLAVRGRRAIAAELKRTRRDKPTEAQLDWLAALAHVPGIECHVWRPENWEEIERCLK